MKISRALLALFALPVALSLAACSGGSAGISNAVGSQSNFRFVNGSPDAGTVDIYYVPTGTTKNSSPSYSAAAYGLISNFTTEPAVAAQVFFYPTGTTTTPLSASCAIPANSSGQNYTVVLAGRVANSTLQCVIFQDGLYSASGQYRVHHASPAAAAAGLGTIGYGVTPGVAASFTQVGTTSFPNTNNTVSTTFFSITPSPAVTADAQTTFDVGAATTTGSPATTLLSIDASQLVTPGATGQPDTGNTLPSSAGTYNNASIFAIDCTGATTPEGTACVDGAGLIGSFDSK
jgi:hypothetical protein